MKAVVKRKPKQRKPAPVIWHGCYDASWKGLITDESFAHPAKMARGLVARIFDYLFERGYIAAGSLIVDPFGGIGTTAIEGASRGCRVVCCELEERFVGFARANFDLHRRTWQQSGDPLPVIVQGDSRNLRSVLAGAVADGLVSSPPYAESIGNENGIDYSKGRTPGGGKKPSVARDAVGGSYGDAPGQLCSLPAGDVDAVISSPPYSEQIQGKHAEQETAAETTTKRRTQGGSLGKSCRHGGYGVTPGSLGNLPTGEVDAAISSPPYVETSVSQDRNFIGGGGNETAAAGCKQGYGISPGQLGEMSAGSVDAAVGSPPFEDQSKNDARPIGGLKERQNHGRSTQREYGTTEGQLGAESGETFWSASKLIVAEVFAILRPGAVAVWVCKDFIRAGKRVPFSDDWRRLCEAAGFETVEWIKASLVKVRHTATLFNGVETKVTERKSFFRRLHEKKRPDLKIDEEDVLVMRKPIGDGGGQVSAVIGSPPFSTDGCQPPNIRGSKPVRSRWKDEPDRQDNYGQTPGQLGNMKEGNRPEFS